jgi:CRISPR-associated protein Cmr1
MEIKIKTLTPIWTGGIETGHMDRVHEIGVIGSMRWWYEAIVRGLGGLACDPIDKPCKYDPDKPNKGLCDVCQLFGTTGWRKRFNLTIVSDETKPLWNSSDSPLNIRPPDRNRGWFLPAGKIGTFTIRLVGEDRYLAKIAALLLFMEHWGTIGAKSQLGYGVFEFQEREKEREQNEQNEQNEQREQREKREKREKLVELVKNAGNNVWDIREKEQLSNHDLPDLRNFGFFCYRFKPNQSDWWTKLPGLGRVATRVSPLVSKYKTVPVTPVLKNEWRFHSWKDEWGKQNSFFGSLRPEIIRSKLAVSWAYQKENIWELRGHVSLHEIKQHPVWEMFCNKNIWYKHFGPGELLTHPAGTWQTWSIEDLAEFLEIDYEA